MAEEKQAEEKGTEPKTPPAKMVPEGVVIAAKKQAKQAEVALQKQLAEATEARLKLQEQLEWDRAMSSGDTEVIKQELYNKNVEIARKEAELAEREKAAAEKELQQGMSQIASEFEIAESELAGLDTLEEMRHRALELQNKAMKEKLAELEKAKKEEPATSSYEFGGASVAGGGVLKMSQEDFDKHIAQLKEQANSKARG